MVLFLLQTFVFNEINLGVYFNIFIYVMFLILLPVETPGWIILPLSFLLGLIIDMGLNTAGLHTSAATFTAFLRPTILRILKPREGYEMELTPGLFNMGFNWFISYASIVLFAHHLWLFSIETFRFSDILFILMKTVASLVINLALILLIQVLTASNRSVK